MQIAIGAIGIGIVLMVGYLVIAQVAAALPITQPVNGTSEANNLTYAGVQNTKTTVFAGFALVAVGIIVLAAFGLINVFK